MNKHYQIELDHEDVVIDSNKDTSQLDSHDREIQDDSRGKVQKFSKNQQNNHKHDDDQENDLVEIHPKEFPEIPLKTVCLTLFLFVVGVGFTIAGITNYFVGTDGIKTLTFFLFGVFLSIPGFYYGYFIIQAYRAETPEDREDILDQIPV